MQESRDYAQRKSGFSVDATAGDESRSRVADADEPGCLALPPEVANRSGDCAPKPIPQEPERTIQLKWAAAGEVTGRISSNNARALIHSTRKITEAK
jgi:hypothetical protein